MLHEFLTSNRPELIELCRSKVALRPSPEATEQELKHGIPMFLDQLIKTLEVEQTTDPMQSRKVSGPSGGDNRVLSEVSETAAIHGRELFGQGFTVDQVVHDYGDLCQAITELAFERGAPIEIEEFRTLNRCLDNGIADAVTEFNYQRDFLIADRQSDVLNHRLGVFAHELRNSLQTAMLAVQAIKAGNVGLNGATGAVLDRSLVGMNNLIDRSLAEVKMAAEVPAQHQLFSLAGFINEVKVSASLQAQVRQCVLCVSAVDSLLAVDADREMLFSALGNLLQNAFKFTRHGSQVTLNAYASADRILIDVIDNGEGLPHGDAERMFAPFAQGGQDKSGLGLGLSISRRGVEASQGILRVRSTPGEGCVFTIDLPRHQLPNPATAP